MRDKGLAEIIERGGIYRNIAGSSQKEVLTELIGSLPIMPLVPADTLLREVLEREALMSTAIGRGIALPHPRNPVIPPESGQFTVVAFLENPVNWNSPDGEMVDTLMLIIASSARQHLNTLSGINFLCRQECFLKLLKERADLKELLAFIREAEKLWI